MMLFAYAIAITLFVYFCLWLHTWSERAWIGPHNTELPLWRWLVRKATHEKDDDADRP